MNILHFPGLTLELQARFDSQQEEHPFIALVTYGGAPSDEWVGGTEDIEGGPYRVLIPTKLLQARVSGLSGKQVFAADSLSSHNRSTPIGVFTETWVESGTHPKSDLPVSVARAAGLFFRSKDPELVDEIVTKARAGQLGFSYDIKDVSFTLEQMAGETVVVVSDFAWRGATVLLRSAAAYQFTQLAAGKLSTLNSQNDSPTEDIEMDKSELTELLKASLGEFGKEVVDPMKEAVKGLTTKVDEIVASNADLVSTVDALKVKTEALEAASATKESEKAKDEKNKDSDKDKDKSKDESDPNAALLAAITEGFKSLGEKLEAKSEKKPDKSSGQRRSFSGN